MIIYKSLFDIVAGYNILFLIHDDLGSMCITKWSLTILCIIMSLASFFLD